MVLSLGHFRWFGKPPYTGKTRTDKADTRLSPGVMESKT